MTSHTDARIVTPDATRLARLESNVAALNRDSTNLHTSVGHLQQMITAVIERLDKLENERIASRARATRSATEDPSR